MYAFRPDALIRARTLLGKTRERLAIDSNLTASAITMYETGHRTPSGASLIGLAKALGVHPAELFVETGDLEAVAP